MEVIFLGIFERLSFWKKKEETLELPKDYELPQQPLSPTPLFSGEQPFSAPQALRPAEPSFGAQPLQPAGGVPIEKELELIAAKLDAIKASIDTVNAKLDKFERKPEEPVRWR